MGACALRLSDSAKITVNRAGGAQRLSLLVGASVGFARCPCPFCNGILEAILNSPLGPRLSVPFSVGCSCLEHSDTIDQNGLKIESTLSSPLKIEALSECPNWGLPRVSPRLASSFLE